MEGNFTGKEAYSLHFDPKDFLNAFKDPDMRTSQNSKKPHYILEYLHKTFVQDGLPGDTLIDIGSGPSIYQLLSACESFKEIIASDLVEQNREEIQKWLEKAPGVFDWRPIVEGVCQLEGDREKWMEKEEKLRRAIKQVLPCDVTLANPFDPLVVPPADCVLSTFCLEAACKDLSIYRQALKNVGSLVKPGGHLVLVVSLHETYYVVNSHKFSCLYLTPEMVKDAVKEAGFEIVSFEILDKKSPKALCDGQHVALLVAQKCNQA